MITQSPQHPPFHKSSQVVKSSQVKSTSSHITPSHPHAYILHPNHSYSLSIKELVAAAHPSHIAYTMLARGRKCAITTHTTLLH